MEIEDIKRAIEIRDVEILLAVLEDVYNNKFEQDFEPNSLQEHMNIVFDYLYGELKSIADEHGIEPEHLDLIGNIKQKENEARQKFDLDKDFNNLSREYKKIEGMSREYIAEHIPFAQELDMVLRNPQLVDRRQELISTWQEEDKIISQPQVVCSYDEEGWKIEGSEHLETPEEVQARIVNVQKYREQLLNSPEYNVDAKVLFKKWYKFICNIKELAELRVETLKMYNKIQSKLDELKLKSFTNDEEFYSQLLDIMAHDQAEEVYWYHGTQDVTSAYSIMEQGLGLARNDLTTTAYCEFTPEQLLLYHRGLCGEIGEDAVVIFKQPKSNGELTSIIQENDKQLNFVSSGLGAFQDKLDYIIPSEYIVGIVNKRDHQVVFADEYRQKQNLGL